MLKTFILAISLVFIGCKGPVGPQGSPGAAEFTLRSEVTQVQFDGTALVTFSNAQIETSIITCWIAETLTGSVWISIAFDSGVILCGISNFNEDLIVQLAGGIPDWYFLVTLAQDN